MASMPAKRLTWDLLGRSRSNEPQRGRASSPAPDHLEGREATHNERYADGWVRLGTDTSLIDAYWLEGFPPAETAYEALHKGRGPHDLVSPIYDYHHAGIGPVQWVNATHDVAAVLAFDAAEGTGGSFHFWVSPGARHHPYEIPWRIPATTNVSGPVDGPPRLKAAVLHAMAYLGLRTLGEDQPRRRASVPLLLRPTRWLDP